MKNKRIDFFNGLDEKEKAEIEPYLQRVSFHKKEIILSEGDPSEWLYIVLSGKIKMSKFSNEGKEIILEIIQPGDMCGCIAVFKGFPYPATAVAMDETQAYKISRKNLSIILDRFPHLMANLTSILSDRMQNSHEMLKNIALERVESRIASLLLKLADRLPGAATQEGVSIDIKLTKQDIADMVGTTVETSIRTMSKFKKEGIVAEQEGKIVIKDIEGLQAYQG